MADDWLSVPQVATRAGVSDNTVRRYIGRFPVYFAGKVFDGVMRYPVETAEVVAKISALYQSGSSRGDIEQALTKEFPATHEPTPDSLATTPPPLTAPLMARMVEALEGLTDQKRQLEDLARENADLRARVARLEQLARAGVALPGESPPNSLQEAPGGPEGRGAVEQEEATPENASEGRSRRSWWKRLWMREPFGR